MSEDTNIVKKTCKELGVTQKELAELLGVNDGTPAQWSSKGEIPLTSIKFMKTLIENKQLKEKLLSVSNALSILDSLKNDNLS